LRARSNASTTRASPPGSSILARSSSRVATGASISGDAALCLRLGTADLRDLCAPSGSLRLNCCALLDVVTHGSSPSISVHQQEDILALGKLLLGLTNISTQAIQNLPKALDVLSRSYSEELKNFILSLLSPPPPGMNKTIEDVLALLGPHILADLNAAHDYNDLLESDMTKELENGRLVRLLTKFGFINERPECVDPWHAKRRSQNSLSDCAALC
jgi:hypothetical protein